jgi:hypothetical protein
MPAAAEPPAAVSGAARGIRNNNPGNIRKTATLWDGEVEGEDPAFKEFETPEAGIKALGANLLAYNDKHGLNTVEGIIGRWAPKSENDTAAYVQRVSHALGVQPGQQLNMRDPATLAGLTDAIAKHENGGHNYTREQLAAGVMGALGQRIDRAAQPAPQQPQVFADPEASGAYPVTEQVNPADRRSLGDNLKGALNVGFERFKTSGMVALGASDETLSEAHAKDAKLAAETGQPSYVQPYNDQVEKINKSSGMDSVLQVAKLFSMAFIMLWITPSNAWYRMPSSRFCGSKIWQRR